MQWSVKTAVPAGGGPVGFVQRSVAYECNGGEESAFEDIVAESLRVRGTIAGQIRREFKDQTDATAHIIMIQNWQRLPAQIRSLLQPRVRRR